MKPRKSSVLLETCWLKDEVTDASAHPFAGPRDGMTGPDRMLPGSDDVGLGL